MIQSPETIFVAILLASLSLIVLSFIILWWGNRRELKKLQTRFSAVINIEDESRKALSELRKIRSEIENLQSNYREKRQIYDHLLEQVAIFDEQLSFAEFGVYEPHFDFSDSEAYKKAIKMVRNEQKAVIKDKTAVHVHTEWSVEGSKAKGKTMSSRAVRLALRAFNAESDAAIANTRWNNAEAMIRRIENARTQIDKANASLNIEITEHYLQLKLEELQLTHEYRERLKVERDERAEKARLQREEKRLERDAEIALREKEKYEDMLAKARAEAGVVSSEEHAAKIAELQLQLADAQEKSARAQAMAERTKTGFVYIISNIGSFGEGVVKIGLTRRLEPDERVKELGDASVPFRFDTHAMIYSEEAPALESALHAEFDDRRVNSANMRKEFFRITLKEIEEAVRRLAPTADFHRDVEAQEFHETMTKRKKHLEIEQKINNLSFPNEI